MGSYSAWKIGSLENQVAELERVLAESREAQRRDQNIATARGFLLWIAEKRIKELEAEIETLRGEKKNKFGPDDEVPADLVQTCLSDFAKILGKAEVLSEESKKWLKRNRESM